MLLEISQVSPFVFPLRIWRINKKGPQTSMRVGTVGNPKVDGHFFALESVLQNGSNSHTDTTDSDVAAEENQQQMEANSPPAAID